MKSILYVQVEAFKNVELHRANPPWGERPRVGNTEAGGEHEEHPPNWLSWRWVNEGNGRDGEVEMQMRI